MRVWIGTSGYSYGAWVGPFYPRGTKPATMLAVYSQSFPLVELNFTYYRAPTPGMLERIVARAPEGFQFLVKVPGTLTHQEDARDLPGFRLAAEAVRRRGRLMGLLCQFPQASHDTPRHRLWIERLADQLGEYRLAVEFRHRSWARPEVDDWLERLGVDLVSVDVPDLPALYPRGLVQTGDRIYVRLHSRLAENWYAEDKGRYDYDYSDDELKEWIDVLAGAAERSRDAFLLFNNCMVGKSMRSQAVENARRIRVLMADRAPQLEVVEPFAPEPDVSQRSLFD
jgi:uncharacterized protein YecE (DUF72 family)